MLMSYNPQYYDKLIQSYGNRKWKDLVAWLMDNPEIPERLAKIMPRVEAKGGFTIRTLNMKDFKNEYDALPGRCTTPTSRSTRSSHR